MANAWFQHLVLTIMFWFFVVNPTTISYCSERLPKSIGTKPPKDIWDDWRTSISALDMLDLQLEVIRCFMNVWGTVVLIGISINVPVNDTRKPNSLIDSGDLQRYSSMSLTITFTGGELAFQGLHKVCLFVQLLKSNIANMLVFQQLILYRIYPW